EKCDESICDSVRRSVHQANLVKSRPAGRQAITGPHTKNLTLPAARAALDLTGAAYLAASTCQP
ncbi:hypothetical protein, partial [Pseudomonas sp. CM25]|uniref:hypothetical protein n=1 Tax=Pseudomonas sp. CM25 TaxID=2738448 RepID=UPI001C49C9A5